jgi:hypothetical protein
VIASIRGNPPNHGNITRRYLTPAREEWAIKQIAEVADLRSSRPRGEARLNIIDQLS